MSVSLTEECCSCGAADCVGCHCGMDCAYSPGHDRGTDAITPLAAMIEAAERFLEEDMAQGNKGRYVLSPGLRRLRATLAFAHAQSNHMRSQRGGQEHLPASPHLL
jgi:hypothetical protein